VERFERRHVAVIAACAIALVSCVALIGVAVAQEPAAKKWPPQFPREGATKLFENDHVIVWEQIGRPKEPFVHKHISDILNFVIRPGKVDVLGPDLQRPKPGQGGSYTKQIYSRGSNSMSYTTAGLGPHVELAPDPNNVPISIFVEIKGTEPKDCAGWSTACR